MTPTRKRSRSARAALMGGSGAFVLVLAGCEQEQDLTFFETKEQCYRGAAVSGQLSEADCDEAFSEALAEQVSAVRRDGQIRETEILMTRPGAPSPSAAR